MDKLTDYHFEFNFFDDETAEDVCVEYTPMPDFSTAAVALENFIDGLRLNKQERQQLRTNIRSLLDTVCIDAAIELRTKR